MLLTIATTHVPATDLGYLLYKNPARVQTFELGYGKATVFYPEASETRCEVALLVDVDPVSLVRKEKGNDNRPLQQYVNDRPYVASSFLSVAIGQIFRSALNGRCEDRPELAEQAIPLEATLAALPCRESPAFLTGLFEPLGYQVEAVRHAADAKFSEWGDSPYYTVTLRGNKKLSDLLSHLYPGARPQKALLHRRQRARKALAPRRKLAIEPSAQRKNRRPLSHPQTQPRR